MKRLIAEWLWRATILCALGWIGWELHQIREELQQSADEQSTAEAEPDPLRDSIDELSDDVAKLDAKLDAIMIAMTRLAR
jgi:chromosome segregation ATPase